MGVDVVPDPISSLETHRDFNGDALGAEILNEAIRLDMGNAYTNEPPLYGVLKNGQVTNSEGSRSIPQIDGIDSTQTYQVYEFQRTPGIIVGSYDAKNNRLLVAKNDDGSIAGFIYSDHDESMRWIADTREALRAIGVMMQDDWSEEDLRRYIGELDDPNSDARKLVHGVYDKYYCVPFETGFSIARIFNRATEPQKEKIAQAALDGQYDVLTAYSFLDSPELIDKIEQIYATHSEKAKAFINDVYVLEGNIDDMLYANIRPNIDITPIREYLVARVRSVFQAAMSLEGEADFSWDLPYDSLAAMQEVVYEFCGLYGLNTTQTLEKAEFGKLETLFLAHAGESAWHDMLKGYLDARWFMKLIEDTPGEMAESSSIFYAALGKELYTKRSETTGDKARQLAMTKSALEQLVEKGALPAHYLLLDTGCGPMEFLSALESSLDPQHRPARVVAVDRDPYPVPGSLSDHVTFEQADMTSPQYLAAHQGEFDLVLHMWSPLNDNEAVLQKNFLDSINRKLKNGGFALIELPIGYVKEMLLEMEQSGRTTGEGLQKHLQAREASKYKKPFEILSLMPLLDRVMESGFVAVNQGSASDVVAGPLVLIYVFRAGAGVCRNTEGWGAEVID